jgi:hypothetical protein
MKSVGVIVVCRHNSLRLLPSLWHAEAAVFQFQRSQIFRNWLVSLKAKDRLPRCKYWSSKFRRFLFAGPATGSNLAPCISEFGSGVWRFRHFSAVCIQKYISWWSHGWPGHPWSTLAHHLHHHYHFPCQVYLYCAESEWQRRRFTIVLNIINFLFFFSTSSRSTFIWPAISFHLRFAANCKLLHDRKQLPRGRMRKLKSSSQFQH